VCKGRALRSQCVLFSLEPAIAAHLTCIGRRNMRTGIHSHRLLRARLQDTTVQCSRAQLETLVRPKCSEDTVDDLKPCQKVSSILQMAASCSCSSETKRLVDNLTAEVSQDRKRRQLRLDSARRKDAAATKKARCSPSKLPALPASQSGVYFFSIAGACSLFSNASNRAWGFVCN
jgi:hypothetical protein